MTPQSKPSVRTGVVLAAGLGSRLRGESDGIKPLTPVAGIPLIFRTLASLERAGCHRAIVVLGYRGPALQRAIEDAYQGTLPIEFVHNDRYALANGVSVLSAASQLTSPFVISMADHVFGDEVMDVAAAHKPVEGGATLLVDSRVDAIFDLDDATKVRTDDGRLVDIGKTIDDYNCIDVGFFVCTRGLLDALSRVFAERGDVSLSDGVAALAKTGKMRTLDIGPGFWQDVDTPAMLTHAEAEIRRHSRP